MDQATSSAIHARKVSAVRLLFVADMRFDFNVVTASPRQQPVGPAFPRRWIWSHGPITKMDTPRLIYRWIYGAPGLNALAHATLGFCGIRPVRRLTFGPIKDSDAA